MSRRRLVVLVSSVCVIAAAILLATGIGAGSGERSTSRPAPAHAKRSPEVVLTPESVDPKLVRNQARDVRRTRARLVDLQGAGAPQTYASGTDQVSPGAPSDTEVRSELREARAQLRDFRTFLGTTAYLKTGPQAKVLPDGTAVAPRNAPERVKRVIQAGNAISELPYKWGGGHGAWRDNGYDCSGSVSFALAGAGLLDSPLTSGLLSRWGDPGRGDWITIYANGGHVFMIVAGLRFDTSGRSGATGTRWQEAPRPTGGFAVRHVPGL